MLKMTMMIVMVMMMIKEVMITSTIMISYWDDNRYPYETKKPWNDEDLARRPRRTVGRTDTPAYRDEKTHLKTKSSGKKFHR